MQRSGQSVNRSLPNSRRNGLTQPWPMLPTRAASRLLLPIATARPTAITDTTNAASPHAHAFSVPAAAGMPSSTQTTKKTPGAANTSTSVKTPTLIVAPAKSSVLTPQDRRITYWVAVPDGPGTRLLTADDASRATSDRPSRRPGMITAYAAASNTRITRAAITSSTHRGRRHRADRLPHPAEASDRRDDDREQQDDEAARQGSARDFQRHRLLAWRRPSASAGRAVTASPATARRPRLLANSLPPSRLALVDPPVDHRAVCRK